MCMDDSCMVTTAKFVADFRKRRVCQFSGEVHRDLARKSDGFGSFFRFKVLELEAICFTYDPLDVNDGNHFGSGGRNDIF
ncbi:Uncharacterised protein [Mycobacterium tuberculosis]|nr:Uncharacterised protein [Mycobacterium tuberculosis]